MLALSLVLGKLLEKSLLSWSQRSAQSHGVLPKPPCLFFSFIYYDSDSRALVIACAVFWFRFLQSHLSSCVQASKHTAEEASASSAFFDELVPQSMTPWEIPTTEGTLLWEKGGPRIFGFRSPFLSPASHLKPQLQVGLLPTRVLSSQSLNGCCLWMAFYCGHPSFSIH